MTGLNGQTENWGGLTGDSGGLKKDKEKIREIRVNYINCNNQGVFAREPDDEILDITVGSEFIHIFYDSGERFIKSDLVGSINIEYE